MTKGVIAIADVINQVSISVERECMKRTLMNRVLSQDPMTKWDGEKGDPKGVLYLTFSIHVPAALRSKTIPISSPGLREIHDHPHPLPLTSICSHIHLSIDSSRLSSV